MGWRKCGEKLLLWGIFRNKDNSHLVHACSRVAGREANPSGPENLRFCDLTDGTRAATIRAFKELSLFCSVRSSEVVSRSCPETLKEPQHLIILTFSYCSQAQPPPENTVFPSSPESATPLREFGLSFAGSMPSAGLGRGPGPHGHPPRVLAGWAPVLRFGCCLQEHDVTQDSGLLSL